MKRGRGEWKLEGTGRVMEKWETWAKLRERNEDTGVTVPAKGCIVLCETRPLYGETEESVFQSSSVVSAIYHAHRAVIRGNMSTSALEIEIETFWNSIKVLTLGQLVHSAEQALNITVCLSLHSD